MDGARVRTAGHKFSDGGPRHAARSMPKAVASPLPRSRSRVLALCVVAAFIVLAGQLVRLALEGERSAGLRLSMMRAAPATTLARPDIVDRQGRLLATDVQIPSLYADAAHVLDPDEATERLIGLFSNLDRRELRRDLADPARRFVWIKRGLSPRTAQRVHDLGLPGLNFVDEVRRTYPAGRTAGHILGRVDVDNRGTAGIERYVDESGASEDAHGARLSAHAPVRLSIDLGVMHAVEDELSAAMKRYAASGAAGLVMDARSGEIIASVSLPGVDPAIAEEGLDTARIDKNLAGTFELGSVMKLPTVALALEDGRSIDSLVDTTAPLTAGRFTIEDLHPLGRPMTVAEVFIHSSNVGAGQLALAAGVEAQKAFLDKLGLWSALGTEAGAGPAPQVPGSLGRAEQITIAYGHGLALSPLQFTAAAAALLNGGTRVVPTLLRRDLTERSQSSEGARVVSEATSRALRDLMRRNVTEPSGTGRRADVPGYRVGGKTGTAEMAAGGSYKKKAVIASFLGAFPAEAPQYVTLVMLFEPKGQRETGGEITAGRNAAPTTARIIERIGPLLGVAASG